MSRYQFTSESVTEGHPDKICDADFRRRPRRDPRAGPEGPRRLRDPGQDGHGRGRRRDHHHGYVDMPVVVRADDQGHRLHRLDDGLRLRDLRACSPPSRSSRPTSRRA